MQYFDFKMPNDFNLFCMGDDHCGSRMRYADGFKIFKDLLTSESFDLPAKKNFFMHSGDIAEMVFFDDKRYFPSSIPDTGQNVLDQIEFVVSEYSDIKEKMLFLLDGNHTYREGFRSFGAITTEIARRLGVNYGTWSSRSTYRDKKGGVMFRQFATHSRANIRSRVRPWRRAKTNKEIAVKQYLEYKSADCLLNTLGHCHQLLCYRPENRLYLHGEDHRVQSRHATPADWHGDLRFIPEGFRYYVSTGSFYKLYGPQGTVSYAEIAGFDPIELGFAVAKVRDQKLVGVDLIAVDNDVKHGYEIIE